MGEIKLLIVDNDPDVRRMVKMHATDEGYSCDEAADGISALKMFRRNDYQLIILNTDLPELDGINVCRQIRKSSDVLLIVISERKDEKTKLSTFEAGADDYVIKPLSLLELMARVKVFLRRNSGQSVHQKFNFGGLLIDTVSHSVHVDDKVVQLTPKEYELLVFFIQHPNRAFSRDILLNEVWGTDFTGFDRTVDTHVKKLRDLLYPYQDFIETVWGFGYKFVIK